MGGPRARGLLGVLLGLAVSGLWRSVAASEDSDPEDAARPLDGPPAQPSEESAAEPSPGEPSAADIISFLGGPEVNASSERYKETRGSIEPLEALEIKNRLFEPNTKCLDHDIKVDNAWMHPCDGEAHQKWYWDEDGALHPLSDPTRCLEEDLGVFARANVWVRPCTGGDNQRWFWDGERLKNRHSGTGQAEYIMCLDEDLAGGGYPGNAMVWPCHDTPNQFWYFATAAEHMRIMEQAVDDYTGMDDVDDEPRDDGPAAEEAALKHGDECQGGEGSCAVNAMQRKQELLFGNSTGDAEGNSSGAAGQAAVGGDPYGPTDALFRQLEENVASAAPLLRKAFDIDHARLGAKAGSSMPPAHVLIFSQEHLEVELLKRNVLAGLDLPLRALAYEAAGAGAAKVIYNSYDYIESRYKLQPDPKLRSTYDDAMERAVQGIPRDSIASFRNDTMPDGGIATIESLYNFSESLRKVHDAIASQADALMFGSVDFQALAEARGETLPEATLILFGGPKAGAVAMSHAPTLGLDAFCQKFLLWQGEGGKVTLSYNDLLALAARQGVPLSTPLRLLNARLSDLFSAALRT